MSRDLPTHEQVRSAMNDTLAEAAQSGRRPTIAAVERKLGVAHPTFYRHFAELIDWFKQQTHHESTPGPPKATRDLDSTLARLRRENQDLHRLVDLYAETIRQLAVDNAALQRQVTLNSGVIDLSTRRRQSQV